MVALGEADAAAQATDAEDTLHFFALKKKQDERVNGKTFADFMQMKQEGTIPMVNDLINDPQFAALFLQ